MWTQAGIVGVFDGCLNDFSRYRNELSSYKTWIIPVPGRDRLQVTVIVLGLERSVWSSSLLAVQATGDDNFKQLLVGEDQEK